MDGQRLGNRKGRKASERGYAEGRGHRHGAANASGDTNAFQCGPQLTRRGNEHVGSPAAVAGGCSGQCRQRRPGESERDWLVLMEQEAWPGS